MFGSLCASRVVLTAAHCLEDVFLGHVLVYWGNDYTTDVAQLTPSGDVSVPPPPGAPSFWAQADSFEQHPDWDPVELSSRYCRGVSGSQATIRAVAGGSLPSRQRMGEPARDDLGLGWRPSHGPDNAQRDARAAHWQEPDFGLSDRSRFPSGGSEPRDARPVRAPGDPEDRWSCAELNSCFGDSGSPLLVSNYGQDYVAGVNYFTGLFCEDYSLYVRVDPFLPFIDLVRSKGGRKSSSEFECVAPNVDGTLTAYFGYENKNGVVVSVPYGNGKSACSRHPGMAAESLSTGPASVRLRSGLHRKSDVELCALAGEQSEDDTHGQLSFQALRYERR